MSNVSFDSDKTNGTAKGFWTTPAETGMVKALLEKGLVRSSLMAKLLLVLVIAGCFAIAFIVFRSSLENSNVSTPPAGYISPQEAAKNYAKSR